MPIDGKNTSDRSDLFGHAPAQKSLFGPGEAQMQPPPQRAVPDPHEVRARLLAILDKVRNSQQMPWSEKDARMWQTVFPNMANWLPDDEANQLRFEFEREMVRLTKAA